MGLLDIWNDWKKENQSQTDGFEDYLPNNEGSGTLDTAGGIKGSGINATMNRTSESPLIKKPMFNTQMFPPGQGQAKIGGKTFNIPKQMLTPNAQAKQAEAIKQAQVNASNKTPMGMPSDPIVTGGSGVKQAEDMGFMQKLSNMAGVDFDKAAANWKDKGGFEGLMSNPAFSLGLALMQSSANGKTINQGILDNFVKSAKISSEFKDRIEARKQEPIQATQADIGEMKTMLERFKISDPNIWEKGFSWLKGENATADYDRAVESIAIEYQKRIASAQKKNKSGKPLVIDSTFKERILKEMLNSKDFKEKKGWFGPFTKGTLEKKSVFRAQGGPVESGKPYVVGEKGPEIIIPTSDGNVLSNDDSQIFNMLLASNPQLQKVSRQRAEKVLRSRFPEYFEG
jgi:hypothetical protein